ncbi:MAG: class I adenylate-forming enzyme family protein [Burkholderiales bacterium]
MINTELIASLADRIKHQSEVRGDKVAWWDTRSSVTFRDVKDQTSNFAGNLQTLGLEPEQCVAIYLPNSVEWVISCLGAVRAGLIAVPISHDATVPEVAYRLKDSGAGAVVTSPERLELVRKLLDDEHLALQIIVTGPAPSEGCHSYAGFTSVSAPSDPRDPVDIDQTAYIVYTSGTTGKAKGVRLTTRSMHWVVAACWAPIAGLNERDTILSPLPLFHSYALNLCVLGVLLTGASEHILERYSSQDVLKLLKTGKYTVLPGVPTMFHYILEAAVAEGGLLLPGVRLCISAGAILPAQLNESFEKQLGVKLVDGYGITETSTMVTMNWPTGGRVAGSCGLPLPGVTVRLLCPSTGKDVDRGQEGELIVRGPNLMVGYHNKPKETAEAVRDGWYHTGDLARSDENGFITITGRLKELIIRGGQNIAPAEIEDAVNKFPSVLDCAAVGVEHQYLGEVPVVFVVARPNAVVDADALLAHCKDLLSSYKVPAMVHVVESIPRTGSGKVMRFKLKELVPSTA